MLISAMTRDQLEEFSRVNLAVILSLCERVAQFSEVPYELILFLSASAAQTSFSNTTLEEWEFLERKMQMAYRRGESFDDGELGRREGLQTPQSYSDTTTDPTNALFEAFEMSQRCIFDGSPAGAYQWTASQISEDGIKKIGTLMAIHWPALDAFPELREQFETVLQNLRQCYATRN